MTQDPARAIAYQLHDSLMVLAPPGWSEVELQVVVTARGLKLASLSTRGEGAKEPRAAPSLGISKEHEAQAVGEELDELAHLLGHQGKHWRGGKARVRRGPEHADLELLDAEKTVWLCRLERAELERLLLTDALLDALLGTEAAFAQLQARLQVTSGSARLTLGTYLPREFTWRWNHAAPDVRRVCAVEAMPAGLSAFWRPTFACDEGFAWALCGHLAIALGARGLSRSGDSEVSFDAVR